jgi:hypothetical protein
MFEEFEVSYRRMYPDEINLPLFKLVAMYFNLLRLRTEESLKILFTDGPLPPKTHMFFTACQGSEYLNSRYGNLIDSILRAHDREIEKIGLRPMFESKDLY